MGTIGALCVLIAFLLTNYDTYPNEKYVYDEWFNGFGALLLIWYAYVGQVWPFLVLNVIWLLWSIYKIVIFYRK